MEAFIKEFYENFFLWIFSTHFIFVALLVGGSFCISFLIQPVLFKINNPKLRYAKTIILLQRFLHFSFLCLIAIAFSGIFIVAGQNFDEGSPATSIIVHVVESLWILMGAIFVYISIKLKRTFRFFMKKEYTQTHENIELITKYLLVFNIFLGIVLIYFNTFLGSKQC